MGSEEGPLELWNISSGRRVHSFGGYGSAVRCMESSPALDTAAIGCADGKVHILNLKYDQTLMSFTHSPNCPVTALSFRSGTPSESDGDAVLSAEPANDCFRWAGCPCSGRYGWRDLGVGSGEQEAEGSGEGQS